MSDSMIDGGNSVTTASSSVAQRVKKIRESRSAQGLIRWEIHVSTKLKKRINDIAKNEDLSVGDTAEALMLFGARCFQDLTSPNMSSALSEKPKLNEKNWLASYLKKHRL